MLWVEGRKKIGIFGYMADGLHPTQVKRGRMEGKDFSTNAFIWVVRSEDHLGLTGLQTTLEVWSLR